MSSGTVVEVSCDDGGLTGRLALQDAGTTAIWERFQQAAITSGAEYRLAGDVIEMSWANVLSLIREFGPQQRSLGFQFRTADDEAKRRIAEFMQQYRQVQAARGQLAQTLSQDEIEERLRAAGFSKHKLRDFQIRDLQQLLALKNGANFSVPGAGKTTVTLALHLLVRQPGQHLLVVCPKAAFPAWRDVVPDFMDADAPNHGAEPFTILAGSADQVARTLTSGRTRFVINYDLMIQVSEVIAQHMSQTPVHLVLDESHRMKSGLSSLRGAFLLGVSPLPVRRDILTGTPMPQSPADLQSQLDFLWPGAGLGLQISRGSAPREVLGNLYVRTTKADLGLPKPKRQFIQVEMARGQMALYGIVKSEFLRTSSKLSSDRRVDIHAARRAVMRLLQLSSNPMLALRSIADDPQQISSGVIDQVIAEGPSTKMRAVAEHARALAAQGRKSVIWTIFTENILQLEMLLADLNPVSLYGAVPTGEPDDPGTREGRIKRFHVDPACMVMIANPAAAGEGISLHKVCHDAIYLDRSYVSTHYLQSIDRIHRLGLPNGVETNIWIYQTVVPAGLGCIDHSVSRRLAQKLRALEQLLNDEDLHEIALDEENADDPIAWDIDPDDVRDLIQELEDGLPYSEEDAG
ncbi:MAG: SNF2-related protein [Phenylobacterium sp.]|uniref:SNF2-related protein n=1 Tax=Phenylobacterium sp. TaxID=1871053 RepID=UPI00391B9ACD